MHVADKRNAPRPAAPIFLRLPLSLRHITDLVSALHFIPLFFLFRDINDVKNQQKNVLAFWSVCAALSAPHDAFVRACLGAHLPLGRDRVDNRALPEQASSDSYPIILVFIGLGVRLREWRLLN